MVLGHSVTVQGSVGPASSGATVWLQELESGRWVGLVSGRLSSSSAFAFTTRPAGAGTEQLRVYAPATAAHAAGASAAATITVLPPLKVATASLLDAAATKSYRANALSTGGHGPVSWSASNLVPGLSISSTGYISGTPTTSGTRVVTLVARDTAGDVATRSVPMVTMFPSVQRWGAINVGRGGYACGRWTAGTTWCWGSNWNGELGTTVNNRPPNTNGTPPPNPGPSILPGSWQSISTGAYHACGIRPDATAWCWGGNTRGELGPGGGTPDMNAHPNPVQVPGMWASLASGGEHTCGIKSDATAWCWGDNYQGQLGNPTNTQTQASNPTPTQVPGAWVSLTAGLQHTCGIRTDATAWCWGIDQMGQLGPNGATRQNPDGTWTTSGVNPTPVQVPGSWASISAGEAQTCGLHTDGTAWCWGYNPYGQLGTATNAGSSTPNPTPAQIPGAWTTLSTGQNNTCGVQANNTGWCWGGNESGNLASSTNLGTLRPNPTPQQVPGTWASISVGSAVCGIETNGSGWCWGSNYYGQLGTSLNSRSPSPIPVPQRISG